MFLGVKRAVLGGKKGDLGGGVKRGGFGGVKTGVLRRFFILTTEAVKSVTTEAV